MTLPEDENSSYTFQAALDYTQLVIYEPPGQPLILLDNYFDFLYR